MKEETALSQAANEVIDKFVDDLILWKGGGSMTWSEIASECEISRPLLKTIRARRGRPSLYSALKICMALGFEIKISVPVDRYNETHVIKHKD